MRFTWSRDAVRDRDHIFDYIAEENFSAAVANDEKIAAIEAQLRQFPLSGRSGRVPGTREYIITGTPYIAIYAISEGVVTVLNLLHGAQQWPPRRES